MKRSILYFSGMLLLVFAAGCSSNTQPGPTTYPQVNYVKGQTYIYYAQDLSATAPYDTVAGSGDTITSKVLATDTTYNSMSGVTEIQNKHSNPGAGVATIDTTYIAQSNGNYYHYNYGIETLNSNSAVLNFANSGKKINGGWALQAKLSANNGDKWVALNDTNLALTLGTVTLIDTATEASDTTIFVGSSQVIVKHSIHSISLTALGGSVKPHLTVDTYVSTADGTVVDIDHPTTIESSAAPGRKTVLIQAP